MKCLSNDVKSIVYRYLYDQVVDQIYVKVPKFKGYNVNPQSYLTRKVCNGKKIEYRIRQPTPASHWLFKQDFYIWDNISMFYIRYSIINGSIYEGQVYDTIIKLKKITSCNSCWQQLIK